MSGQFSTSERRAINQFAGFTDTNARVAVQYLRKTGWDIQEAINEYYSSNNNKSTTTTTSSNNNNNIKVKKQDIVKIFNRFKDPDNPETIGIDGSIEFIESLGLSVEDPRVLAVCYELQAPQMGQFNLEGFVAGWSKYGADTIDKMGQTVREILGPAMDTDLQVFKQIYRFTFDFAKPPHQRSMPFDTALDYWKLLLTKNRFVLIDEWIQFLNTSSTYRDKSIPRDTWNMILEFAQVANSKLGDSSGSGSGGPPWNLDWYDMEAAWPSIIDEFVLTLQQQKSITG